MSKIGDALTRLNTETRLSGDEKAEIDTLIRVFNELRDNSEKLDDKLNKSRKLLRKISKQTKKKRRFNTEEIAAVFALSRQHIGFNWTNAYKKIKKFVKKKKLYLLYLTVHTF